MKLSTLLTCLIVLSGAYFLYHKLSSMGPKDEPLPPTIEQLLAAVSPAAEQGYRQTRDAADPAMALRSWLSIWRIRIRDPLLALTEIELAKAILDKPFELVASERLAEARQRLTSRNSAIQDAQVILGGVERRMIDSYIQSELRVVKESIGRERERLATADRKLTWLQKSRNQTVSVPAASRFNASAYAARKKRQTKHREGKTPRWWHDLLDKRRNRLRAQAVLDGKKRFNTLVLDPRRVQIVPQI